MLECLKWVEIILEREGGRRQQTCGLEGQWNREPHNWGTEKALLGGEGPLGQSPGSMQLV